MINCVHFRFAVERKGKKSRSVTAQSLIHISCLKNASKEAFESMIDMKWKMCSSECAFNLFKGLTFDSFEIVVLIDLFTVGPLLEMSVIAHNTCIFLHITTVHRKLLEETIFLSLFNFNFFCNISTKQPTFTLWETFMKEYKCSKIKWFTIEVRNVCAFSYKRFGFSIDNNDIHLTKVIHILTLSWLDLHEDLIPVNFEPFVPVHLLWHF